MFKESVTIQIERHPMTMPLSILDDVGGGQLVVGFQGPVGFQLQGLVSRSEARMFIFQAVGSPSSGELLGEKAWQKLLTYAINGLPSCYANVGEFLYDFYPDLPWDRDGQNEALRYMLAQPADEMKIICEGLHFDFHAELTAALNRPEEL